MNAKRRNKNTRAVGPFDFVFSQSKVTFKKKWKQKAAASPLHGEVLLCLKKETEECKHTPIKTRKDAQRNEKCRHAFKFHLRVLGT